MKKLFNYENNNLFNTYCVATIILFLTLFCVVLKAQEKVKGTFDQITEEMVSKIKTEIDPQFVYEYEQTKFVPPKDKTLLIMGQLLKGLQST